MIRPVIRPVALIMLMSAPAMAQEVDCANPITQLDMTMCEYQAWERADADLNDMYGAAMAAVRQSDADYPIEGLSEEDRLRTAQRAWVAFRDANCDVAGYPMRGGSAEPMLINACLRSMTEARTNELMLLTMEF